MTDAHGVINVMDTEPVVDNGGAEMVSPSEEIDEFRKHVNELNKCVSGLVEKNQVQDAKIRTLEKRQFDINERLRAQERYSRKDSIIICNPPFDSNDNRHVLENTLWFFDAYLNIRIGEERIVACHILPGTGNKDRYDSVICKFVHFDQKDTIFGARRKLKNVKYNNANICMNENLPKYDAEIKAEAQKQGFVTSTKNCKVSVLVQKNNVTSFKNINFVEDLGKIENPIKRAISKQKYDNKSRNGDDVKSPDAKVNKNGW